MKNDEIKKNRSRIIQIKREIQKVGDMRPGSLTQQTYKKGNYTRQYWQISYTQNKKSKTEYVREGVVKILQQEIAEYNAFKKLIEEWVEIAVQISKEEIKLQNSEKDE